MTKMKLIEEYKKIIESKEFKQIKDLKLRTLFFSKDVNQEIIWNFTFIKDDELYTFRYENNKVTFIGKDEEFNKDIEFQNLELEKLEFNIEHAEELIKPLIQNEKITKEICTITNSAEFGLHWNITKITASLDIINIKVSNKGQIIKHSKESLLNMGKWEKGTKE